MLRRPVLSSQPSAATWPARSAARPVAPLGRYAESITRVAAQQPGIEPSQQVTAVGDISQVSMRMGDGGRLRFGRFKGWKPGYQGWHKLFPRQSDDAVQAYENKAVYPYPTVNLWLPGGLSGWGLVPLRLVHDSRACYVLKCSHADAQALGLDVGDSLGLMSLWPAADCVIVLATCTPTGELKPGGATASGAGGGAGGSSLLVAAAAAAAHAAPPPPAFTAAYSLDLKRQQLEVTLPPLAGDTSGGTAASEPADQQRMTLLCVHMQPQLNPQSTKPKPVDMPSASLPVVWQRRGSGNDGGPAGGVGGGAPLLRGLPPTLLQELPPQGRLLVLPQQGLVVLVAPAAPTAVAAAAAALATKSARDEKADAVASTSNTPVPARPRTPARAIAPPPLTSPPPLLVHFTVSSSGPDQGPGEGGSAGAGAGDGSADEAGQLLQLVADEGMSDWASLQEAWGLPPAQRDWQRPLQEVEVLLPQLLALGAGPADRLQWARVPMWLLPSASGEGSGGGSGSGSSSPVLCCRRATAAALGLQPGDRVALHPAGPGCVVLVTGPAAGAGQGPPLDTASGIQVASALTGREPILLTWTKKLRVKINLSSEGRSDWTPLFPAEAPLARGDSGHVPVAQEVVLWAPPALAPVPAAACNPISPLPMCFSLGLNNPGRSSKFMLLTYRSRFSGHMQQPPDGGVMAVLPGSRLVVAWWWPGAA
ncbi:hypothetical protein HYH02_014812 [Chlamydomonas schloesseri]|uniref:Uncharacterized protein n=1 Tax=Chlamydomonas schloesseri TaxID=2026947 RepID=A0A835SG65_9CHLO|nr:hypothetical protein HYH02_014812 [Chlamydomonas schloesseri]|eukprot:KAG2426384.1 hypothetical protein HYH02_014812 [Chlamydomonas schloesseri]